MAQDTKPIPQDPATGEDKRPGFHYYSGGEVKELENTRVSPLLWVFWSIVIAGAIGYLVWGGALGPNSPISKPYVPIDSTPQAQATIQADLNKKMYGKETAQMADMTRIPLPAGEGLTTAISNGSNIYQSYCIGCHGPNQDGNGVNASSLNPKPRNLHDAPFMRETLTYPRINTSLHYGVHGTAMPRWENTLSEKEIQEVIAYVLSLTWNMPASGSAVTPAGAAETGLDSGANATPGQPSPGKSPSGSTTGTAGGSFVHGGGSISNSPEPITPTINGNPAAATSTAPPSQSGQPAAVQPGSGDLNAPDSGSQNNGAQNAGPKAPPPSGRQGGAIPGVTR